MNLVNLAINSGLVKLLEPFVKRFIDLAIPKSKVYLYSVVVSSIDNAFSSLEKLRDKVIETKSELDDQCYNAGLDTLETIFQYGLEKIKEMRINK